MGWDWLPKINLGSKKRKFRREVESFFSDSDKKESGVQEVKNKIKEVEKELDELQEQKLGEVEDFLKWRKNRLKSLEIWARNNLSWDEEKVRKFISEMRKGR